MRRVLATALLSPLLLLTGCGGTPASPAPPPAGAEAVGLSIPPSSPSAAPSAPAPTPALPEGNPAPAYPTTHRAYAEAAIAAWVDGNVGKLGSLTTAMVQEQIIEIPHLNISWIYQNCDGTTGGSYCTFRNADGDLITLKVVSQYLGQAHAINQVSTSLTVYPADGEQYVRRFVAAWMAGNLSREQAYAKTSVVTLVGQHPRPAAMTPVAVTSKSGGAGLMIVTVHVGETIAFRLQVGTTLLGQKQAILAYEAIP